MMDNHYHLFLMTQNPNISKAMHFLHCSYGSWFRSKYRLPGAIFQGRFKSIIVDTDSYAIQLATFIHLNPFRCGYDKKLGDYLWNSLQFYIKRKKGPEYLDQALVLDQFGKTKGKAIKKYLEHVLENTNMKNPLLNPRFGIAVGSDSFLEEIEDKIKELEYDDEIPSMKMKNRIQPEKIVKQIADYFNVSIEKIMNKGRNNLHRKIAIYLINRVCDFTLKEIGKFFDTNYSSVSKTIIRFEEECRDDLRLRKLCDGVKGSIELQNKI